MKGEINRILERLKRIDHKQYNCGFEFADNAFFDEICRCFAERKMFAYYITILQKENEKLRRKK